MRANLTAKAIAVSNTIESGDTLGLWGVHRIARLRHAPECLRQFHTVAAVRGKAVRLQFLPSAQRGERAWEKRDHPGGSDALPDVPELHMSYFMQQDRLLLAWREGQERASDDDLTPAPKPALLADAGVCRDTPRPPPSPSVEANGRAYCVRVESDGNPQALRHRQVRPW